MRPRALLLFTALTCLTSTTMAQHAKTVTLRIIETSDVHGAFFPYDFIERRPMRGTMARVSSYIKGQRQQFGRNLILVDNGDILQGQPTCYYTNYVATTQPNIAAEVVNYLQYDAECFGNHDLETGHAVYDKWIGELHCPVLGANVVDNRTGKPYTQPYVILEREGVRVGVLGMLSPAIPNWLHESLWRGMHFEEMVASARKWVRILKEQEQADVVVGLFHSGWDGGITTPDYMEDATKSVAEQVEGFDIIFFGHDHIVHNTTTDRHVLCLDPSANAVNVAQATITIQLENEGERRRATVVEKVGEIVDITAQPVDDDFVAHFRPSIDAVEQFVEQRLGTFTEPMYARDAFFGSAPFTDIIHQLQLSLTKADISFTAPLTFNSEIKAGPIYMSDMFKLYKFENQVYTIMMTGSEIRRYLEMSYALWTNTMQTADDHIMLLAPKAPGDNQREGFKNYTFNFDSAAGIDYEVDVTKPEGQKVRILQMSDGRPFSDEQWYRVAVNSYRGNGGGELLSRGAGIPLDSIPRRIVSTSERDLRHYLTEHIRQVGNVVPKALGNWRFVPEEWTAPAIERDRKLLFPNR